MIETKRQKKCYIFRFCFVLNEERTNQNNIFNLPGIGSNDIVLGRICFSGQEDDDEGTYVQWKWVCNLATLSKNTFTILRPPSRLFSFAIQLNVHNDIRLIGIRGLQ